MQKLILKHKTDINTFLACWLSLSGGYHGEGDKCRLKLAPEDFEGYVSGGSQHLSPTVNATPLPSFLFMYECLVKAGLNHS